MVIKIFKSLKVHVKTVWQESTPRRQASRIPTFVTTARLVNIPITQEIKLKLIVTSVLQESTWTKQESKSARIATCQRHQKLVPPFVQSVMLVCSCPPLLCPLPIQRYVVDVREATFPRTGQPHAVSVNQVTSATE